MSFWKRLLSTITGRARHRLPDQLALLGAPHRLVEEVRRMADEQQEAAFIAFVEGKHACMLDWRAQRDDVFSGLAPLLGDFSFLILVPAAGEREFVRTAGPWLIAD
jgi:hypothetical protein